MSAHSQHSADLQWLLVRRNSKFLHLRNGIRLSSDFMSNTSTWSKRHAGVVADRAAAVKPRKGGKALAVVTKDGASFKTEEFAAGAKAGAVAKAVAAVRPDLSKLAYRRARKLAILNSRTARIRETYKARSANKSFKKNSRRGKH